MPCNCLNREHDMKRPETPCVFCAHKHVAAAKALYELELGYRSINKSDAIGQLILAAWHLQKDHKDLAWQCRDIWLRIEKLLDCTGELHKLQQVLWSMAVDAAVEKESPKNRIQP